MVESTQALMKTGPSALAVPEDLTAHAGKGTEGIGQEDVRPPRLVLAQSGSPQVKKATDQYIAGLGEGDLFNDLTKEKYTQPLKFIVIRYLGKHAIEFWPEESKERKAGQIVKDRDVKLNDPRALPTTDADGNWAPPIADIFADYLIFLPESGEVTSLTFKNADLSRKGAGTLLNSLVKYPLNVDGAIITRPPAWARTFELSSASKSDGKNSWAIFNLKPAGITVKGTREACASIYEQFSALTVVVNEEQTTEGTAEGVKDEDIPF